MLAPSIEAARSRHAASTTPRISSGSHAYPRPRVFVALPRAAIATFRTCAIFVINSRRHFPALCSVLLVPSFVVLIRPSRAHLDGVKIIVDNEQPVLASFEKVWSASNYTAGATSATNSTYLPHNFAVRQVMPRILTLPRRCHGAVGQRKRQMSKIRDIFCRMAFCRAPAKML
jgi:hypothetical protein